MLLNSGDQATVDKLISTGENIIGLIRGCAWIMIAIAAVTVGGMFILGGQEAKEKAKKSIPWIGVGAILILGAIELAKLFTAQISF